MKRIACTIVAAAIEKLGRALGVETVIVTPRPVSSP